ncbi:MAG: peroxiredoxin [Burkholderiales bacterium]|uniref:thioredoxin-dependent peroxiredoxin n=1 Tax=Ottowia pentelensis TaxID=511108 RepID=A0ABV6PUT2_9BURK|nr:peroxiredoxin [Ottowia sp.]MBN9404439.1 peroxiredoxin [Burkholderiales bacterium]MBS0402686.1 peroxiredoxin [Pseudomonadota bacterium]MBS0413197.1 peroxiredoxin [Pseudomonadota bacterium]HMN56938.1 peroxiredoxin [Ottowia sp.]
MKRRHALALTCAALLPLAAHAALKPGDAAPEFKSTAALAGQTFAFDLAEALKKGPVVLYFFPKAFTQGCTIEANAFAEATPKFAALGARVIGISHDDIDTLKRFSTEACRDQFAVGSDPKGQTIKAYDAASLLPGVANRISYVIGQDGRIAFVHQGSDPLRHVELTLKAVGDGVHNKR